MNPSPCITRHTDEFEGGLWRCLNENPAITIRDVESNCCSWWRAEITFRGALFSVREQESGRCLFAVLKDDPQAARALQHLVDNLTHAGVAGSC